MRKYFDLLLDLLEIQPQERQAYSNLAAQLEQIPRTSSVLFAHRAKFIFSSYFELLKEAMQPEEFILLGDVDSAVPLWEEGQLSSKELITKLLEGKIPAEEVLFVDESTRNILLDESKRKEIKKLLESQQKILILG